MELQQVSYRLMIPTRIKDLRKQASYTIKQVADQLGVKIGRYQHYEAGRATPDIDMLIAISHIYKLSLDQLLSSEPPKEGEFERKYNALSPERRQVIDLMLANDAK